MKWGSLASTIALACALAACQTASSPAGKPVALESIEGAPPAVRTALAGELVTAASARQVELVGTGDAARYRVRGYLTAEPSADGGTALAFVWDVFDAQQRRAQRVTGSSPIKAASRKNPWEGLDKEALARLAAKSMDEIASFLSAGAGATVAAEPEQEASEG